MTDPALIRLFEEEIPFHRLLGIRIESVDDNTVRVRVPFREELIGDMRRPALHGGVLSAIADTAGGLLVWNRLGRDSTVSTIDMRIDYLNPGDNRDLLCTARILRFGRRVAVTAMEMHQGDPSHIVAEGRGTYSLRRPTDDE